jgi:hypothetical protein
MSEGVLSPIVVGATGGSGTRLVARMLIAAGVDLGQRLNESLDALAFITLYDRFVDPFLRGEALDRQRFAAGLTAAMNLHRAARTALPWGWKNPRSLFLLPLLDEALPGLCFVHVVRHGGDMATSTNQNQLRLHGAALLGAGAGELPQAQASARLWHRANGAAADYGRTMGPRYWRIRFEDVCADPGRALGPLLDRLSLATPREGWPAVRTPRSRWKDLEPELRSVLDAEMGGTLARFGYGLSGSGLLPAPAEPAH